MHAENEDTELTQNTRDRRAIGIIILLERDYEENGGSPA
jgi:hypothetical protein